MAESTAMAVRSSLLLSPKSTSLPSKYMAQVPAVAEPSAVGVKAMMSSSWPVIPGTLKGPRVETRIRPSDSSSTESTSSSLLVRPTFRP